MADRLSTQFSTGSQEDTRRFIEEYALDALDRVPAMEACDSYTFVQGHPTTGDRTDGLQVPPPDLPDSGRRRRHVF